MREIKFRAWDGEMHHDYIRSDREFTDWGATNEPSYELHRTIVLMQFTGLTDKNGKEIYEGDILGCALGNTVVRWMGQEWVPFVAPKGSQFEVIGNIYENPELLK